MSKAFAFALAGDGSETLELDVFSVIGESFWFDSISASQVRRLLKANAKAKKIHLRVHSDGGDVFDAQAIYADLQAHPARVEADIMGLAASAATLMVMAADEIRMAEGAWFMIHDPWGGLAGKADELRAWADVLDKMRQTFAKAYSQRSKLPESDILALMSAETWMTAAEAKSKGFVDSVVPMNAKASASAGFAKAHRGALRSVSFAVASADYLNVPPALRAELEAAQLGGRNPSPPPAPAPEPQLALALGQRPEPTEKPDMSIPKSICAALNLNEAASEEAVLDALRRANARAGLFTKVAALCALTADQSEDAVVGTVQAWKESAAKLPAAEAKLAEVKASSEKTELDTLLDKGRAEHKLTKDASDKLRARVEGYNKAKAEKREPTDEEWSLSQARAYVNALPAQPHLAGATNSRAGKTEGGAPPPQPAANALTWEGKSYEQLTGAQAASLEESDPDLFKEMRADWKKRGEPEFKAA